MTSIMQTRESSPFVSSWPHGPSTPTHGSTGERRVSMMYANRPATPHYERSVTEGEARQVESRVVSSRVVGEEWMASIPADFESRTETEDISERITKVNAKTVVEVPRTVTKPAENETTTVVGKTEVHYVNKHVEVPKFEETIRKVAVKKVVEVPREVIRTVRKKEVRRVVQEVEVPGDIVEVVSKVEVERRIDIPRYVDKETPLIVAQSHHPRILETGREVIRVEVRQLNPRLVPVDVFIPKPVLRPLVAKERRDFHRVTTLPAAHHNSLVKKLNSHLLSSTDKHALDEMYIKDAKTQAIPFLPEGVPVPLMYPMPGVVAEANPLPSVREADGSANRRVWSVAHAEAEEKTEGVREQTEIATEVTTEVTAELTEVITTGVMKVTTEDVATVTTLVIEIGTVLGVEMNEEVGEVEEMDESNEANVLVAEVAIDCAVVAVEEEEELKSASSDLRSFEDLEEIQNENKQIEIQVTEEIDAKIREVEVNVDTSDELPIADNLQKEFVIADNSQQELHFQSPQASGSTTTMPKSPFILDEIRYEGIDD